MFVDVFNLRGHKHKANLDLVKIKTNYRILSNSEVLRESIFMISCFEYITLVLPGMNSRAYRSTKTFLCAAGSQLKFDPTHCSHRSVNFEKKTSKWPGKSLIKSFVAITLALKEKNNFSSTRAYIKLVVPRTKNYLNTGKVNKLFFNFKRDEHRNHLKISYIALLRKNYSSSWIILKWQNMLL